MKNFLSTRHDSVSLPMLTMPPYNYKNQGKLLYPKNQQQFSYWLWHITSLRATVIDYVPGIEMSQNIRNKRAIHYAF